MKVIVNFSNILVAIVLLLIGLSVLTRHRLASYIVGGFISALAILSILTFLRIIVFKTGSINIG
jgi:hypothetical protein